MNAEDYRRKARYFLTLARQLSSLEDKTALLRIAAYWMERAEEVEQKKRVQQTQPDTEPVKETAKDKVAEALQDRIVAKKEDH